MDNLRFVIIGAGAGIARLHLTALRQIPDATIVGMADVDPARAAPRAADAGCPIFADHREALASRPDVAVICAPHPFHATLAQDCLAAGAHVLVEKPMAVEVREADAMIAAADATGRLLAVNFQMRFLPVVERAHALIESGALGPLVRTLCIEPWYRTAAYYRSAGWRGSWQGEGGGVLMNQAPHTLDLLCHLAGMPVRVYGRARTRYHAIECEDTAEAMLEYTNGAPGYLYVSTVETGVQRRLQIIGEQGALEIVGNTLTTYRFASSTRDFMLTSSELYVGPAAEVETIELSDTSGGHLAVYRDLIDAIRAERVPRSDGRQARMSLELANAVYLSSALGQTVGLPLDRGKYASLLAGLKAGTGR